MLKVTPLDCRKAGIRNWMGLTLSMITKLLSACSMVFALLIAGKCYLSLLKPLIKKKIIVLPGRRSLFAVLSVGVVRGQEGNKSL